MADEGSPTAVTETLTSAPAAECSAEPSFTVTVKWSGRELPINLGGGDSVETLKRKLEQETMVSIKRQKLLGLKTKEGKAVTSDEVQISQLSLKPGIKYMMMGTPEAVIEAHAKAAEAAPEIQDDSFDLTEEQQQNVQLQDTPEVQEKLERRLRSVEVKIINPPRPGKKCLVLDIDYTLFDLGSAAERPEELARPYLHEFLTACYEYYDIIIWSATSMKWVEVKMKELGVLGNANYKLVCMLDHAAMLTVRTEKYGVFDCKPLAFIWRKFPDFYNGNNTVMLDDLRRNYVLNRQQGLVIRPFKRAHLNRNSDRELVGLTTYLTVVGQQESLADLDHKRWEEFVRRRARGA